MRTAVCSLLATAVLLTLPMSFGRAIADERPRDPAAHPYRPVARGDLVQLERGPGAELGGELVVYGVVGSIRDGRSWPSVQDTPRFNTFSVERGEPLEFGVSYRVDHIRRKASAGGLGGQVSQTSQGSQGSRDALAADAYDPIDPRTAYLYEQFHFQRLSQYAYDDYVSPRVSNPSPRGLRNAQAEQLQRAIWFLENELEALDPATGDALGHRYDPTDLDIARKTLGAESLAYQWIAEADAAVRDRRTTIGQRVRVLTLVDQDGCRIQDVLMVLPYDPVPPIRESARVAPAASDPWPGGLFASAYASSSFLRGQTSDPGTPTTSSGSDPEPDPDPKPKPTPTPGPIPVPTPEPSSLLIWNLVAGAAAMWARRGKLAGIAGR